MCAMDDDSLTLVTLITANDRDDDAPVHSLAWRIPTASAQAFAAAMTERYGEPVAEGLATVGATVAAAERNEDGFVFTGGKEAGDG